MTDYPNKSLQHKAYSFRGASALCAIAASKAALTALITGEFPDPVGIILPQGEVPYFLLNIESLGESYATAGIVKDSAMLEHIGHFKDSDDQIANGATIIATLHPAPPESGLIVQFNKDDTIKSQQVLDDESLQFMHNICHEICTHYNVPTDLMVTLSIIE